MNSKVQLHSVNGPLRIWLTVSQRSSFRVSVKIVRSKERHDLFTLYYENDMVTDDISKILSLWDS